MSKCSLYRHFDASGALLYVGISKNAVCRLGKHGSSGWYDQLKTMTVEHFDTRRAAANAERQAIQSENPIHNKMRYPGKSTVAAKTAATVSHRQENPGQFYPAGDAWLKVRFAFEECQRVMDKGGDVYAPQ